MPDLLRSQPEALVPGTLVSLSRQGRIQVALGDARRAPRPAWHALTEAERSLAARLPPEDRDVWMRGRGWCRAHLRSWVRGPGADPRVPGTRAAGGEGLGWDAGGRPRWGGAPRWDVSLSHEGPWWMLAAVREGRVGVDLAPERAPPGWQVLAADWDLPATDERAFLQAWVVYEARLKVDGRGVGEPARAHRVWRIPTPDGRLAALAFEPRPAGQYSPG